MLPGAFVASYPNTREASSTESFQKSSPLQQCNYELDSEGTIEEILIDKVKKSAKVALLMKEIDRRFTGCVTQQNYSQAITHYLMNANEYHS